MARSSTVRKFLFTRSFDDPDKLYLPGERNKAEREAAAAAEAAEEARKAAERERKVAEREQAIQNAQDIDSEEPVEEEKEFTQSDLDAAREEGHIAGHTAALEEAETAREHYIADAVNLIAQGLDGLQENQDAANKQTADFAMRMVFGVVQRLLPDYTHHYAVDNMETFVRRVLPLAIGEPSLTVRAHAMIAPDLELRLKEVFTRTAFQGSYAVIPDYELQPGDCKLEWDGGGADRDEGRIWAEIREVVAGNIGDANADDFDRAAEESLQGSEQETVETEDPDTDAQQPEPDALYLDTEDQQDTEQLQEDTKAPEA